MRFSIQTFIIALVFLIPPKRSVGMQPHDSQSATPANKQFESSEPVRSHENPLIEGRLALKRGVSESNLDAMYAARAAFERTLTDPEYSTWGHYYIGLTEYRVANILLAHGKIREPEAWDSLKKAVEHLQIASRDIADGEEGNRAAAEIYALLSYVYGRQISLSPLKGIYLGPKSKNLLKKAEKLAPENPRVVLSSAIGYLKTPRLVGGNDKKAMEGFRHAAELFASEGATDPMHPVWGHSDAYIWMGIAYRDWKDQDAARAAFEKALEIDPDNRWAREMLAGVSAR